MIVTVEEHSILGGFGSAVAEVLSTCDEAPKQLLIGMKDRYPHAASYDFLLEQEGLKSTAIAQKIIRKLKNK